MFVLPCPKACFDCVSCCSKMMLLLLSGDVELNPGPETRVEKMMAEMLENQRKMRDVVKDIKENQTSFHKRMDELANKITQLETFAKNSNDKVCHLENMVKGLSRIIQTQQNQLIDLEDRSRTNNLVIFGVPENREKTNEDLSQSRLGVVVKSVKRVRRIGRMQREKLGSIMVNFTYFNEKLDIFLNCRELKGLKISISDDFSRATMT